MANNYIKMRLKNRIDLTRNWQQVNPILLLGEIGIESDTGFSKVGDGSSRWNDLDYMRCPGTGKIIASIYQPDSDAWIDIDMEDVTIGTESDAWIEII